MVAAGTSPDSKLGFDFGPFVVTHRQAASDPRRIVQDVQERYLRFFAPFGKYLDGAAVLDLGCHDGLWSYASLHLGAARVCGIDIHPETIERAKSNFKGLNVDSQRYEFKTGEMTKAISEFSTGQFDVILCLGILYHMVDPVGFLWDVAGLQPKHVLIDTNISYRSEPVLEYIVEAEASPENGTGMRRNSPGRNVVGLPSSALVSQMMVEFGYVPATPNLCPETSLVIRHSGAQGIYRRLSQWFTRMDNPPHFKWK